MAESPHYLKIHLQASTATRSGTRVHLGDPWASPQLFPGIIQILQIGNINSKSTCTTGSPPLSLSQPFLIIARSDTKSINNLIPICINSIHSFWECVKNSDFACQLLQFGLVVVDRSLHLGV